jgi:hypothetical protein
VLVGKLAEILLDQRPGRKVAAMFLDMAFGSPIYERLRALGFNNVFEVNFGLTHTPDRAKAKMRAYMWDRMKDWLLTGAVETDRKMATDLAGLGCRINRNNLLVIESKADMQKRGQASPDDGDALGADLREAVAAGATLAHTLAPCTGCHAEIRSRSPVSREWPHPWWGCASGRGPAGRNAQKNAILITAPPCRGRRRAASRTPEMILRWVLRRLPPCRHPECRGRRFARRVRAPPRAAGRGAETAAGKLFKKCPHFYFMPGTNA